MYLVWFDYLFAFYEYYISEYCPIRVLIICVGGVRMCAYMSNDITKKEKNRISISKAQLEEMNYVMSADFTNIYRVERYTGAVEVLRYTNDSAGMLEKLKQSDNQYRTTIAEYIRLNVFSEDKSKLNFYMDLDNVAERLKNSSCFQIHYRVMHGYEIHYYRMKCCRAEDREDFEHIYIGFANEDSDRGGENLADHFDSADKGERRKVLIVEDVELNREILKSIVEEEYDVLTAENGAVALKLLAEHYRDLSVILLDMHMPVCDGFEFLSKSRADALFASVPVIVTTGSDNPDDEIRCLELGASDFITKPYNPRVVISRIRSIIKLHESDVTLAAIEYDDLTGLYTRPAFYHYAENMISAAGDAQLDMLLTEIENFSQIESTYGDRLGDELLGYFGKELGKKSASNIGFRRDNQFIFLIRHNIDDIEACLKILDSVSANAPIGNVVIKYGFYFDIDKSKSISTLCDRVRLTVDSIRGSFISNYAVYDERIAKREADRAEMEADFDKAIANNEFVIYQQPKYDVISEKIIATEALVRWKKPDGRMVSPGAFIPLFEEDGLIIRLDEYVFRKVCMMQKSRIDRGLPVVRVSINLSRATLITEGIAEKYAAIVREAGIPSDIISIELTESFALENNRIQELAESLVNAGFRLDMDDFGSGYSSMSGLVTLPFSVVKIDKSLIDRIGDSKGEVLIEYTVIIAHKLNMTVVAEGAETKEQVDFLRSVNCDLIQGFYYSPPVPEDKLEELLDKSAAGRN